MYIVMLIYRSSYYNKHTKFAKSGALN